MLKEKLVKLMKDKKKKSGMSDIEQEAKLKAARLMGDEASNAMKDGLTSLKKVSVASDSEAGLKKGLDKAKEILSSKEHEDLVDESEDGSDRNLSDPFAGDEGRAQDAEEEESAEHEADETPKEEESEHEGEDDSLSEDEIDAKIERLKALKAKRS